MIGRVLLALALAAGAARAGMPDLGPPPVFAAPEMARVKLGQLLFYDPILSGNRNISCATCHHPRFGTTDNLSLGVGEGGVALGTARRLGPDEDAPEQRIPRNAPGLWNLGAAEFTVMFHDGRLEADPTQPGGIRTPLGAEMAVGFDSVLAAQAMFPVLAGDEMAGHYSENDISTLVRSGLISQPGGAWEALAARVAAVPEYRAAFDEVLGPGAPITFQQIANMIADFTAFEWRADDSLFDKAMRGEAELPEHAAEGIALFYGRAGCSGCHSGWFQTDHAFHAIAMPQIGPGKAARFEVHHRDEGRMRVTGDLRDAYAFRTPSLRNVTLTAPYGHDGAYATLRAVIAHHADPVAALKGYDPGQAVLPDFPGAVDRAILEAPEEVALIASHNTLAPVALSEADIDALVAFLGTLEDKAQRLGVPETVPSGLPVDR